MMIQKWSIDSLRELELKAAERVFEAAIPDAFEKEGLSFMKEEISGEILHKKKMLKEALEMPAEDIYFMVAKLEEGVIGIISISPCGEDIKKCTQNELAHLQELGSLYVLPEYQDQGIGSALIGAMTEHLSGLGIAEFCLDSGYKRAQKRWQRKFGAPCKVVPDYWGPGSDHMIWHCRVADFVR
jgi:GNAT superfamily N-acetyltransferase